MAKVIITYESKYGNTRLVAETIAEGVKEASGAEVELSEIKKTDLNKLADYDAILIGCPNHFGRATLGIKGFINKLGKLNLEGKLVAVFDTYLGSDFEKAVKKMETQLGEKVSGLKMPVPGLSVKVAGMKGPVAEGELPGCREFGVKIASQLQCRK